MATRHSSKRRQERRPRAAGSAGASKEPTGDPNPPDPSSDHTRAAIEAQRRTLQMAESVLGCLVTALEYSSWIEPRQRPDYSDTARAVRCLLARAIERLDSVNLKRAAAAIQPGS